MIRRIDPVGCGCTDCLTGVSVPIDQCPVMVFDRYCDFQYGGLGRREVVDASSTTEREFDEWIERAEVREGA